MDQEQSVIILDVEGYKKCERCHTYLKKEETVFDFYVGAYACDSCLELLVVADCIPTCNVCGFGVGVKRDQNDCQSCKHL